MSLIETVKTFFELVNTELFKVNDRMKDIERRMNWKMRKFKRNIKNTFFYLIFVLLTIGFLSAGLIIFLNRFFPLDVILLVFGAVSAFFALIFHLLE